MTDIDATIRDGSGKAKAIIEYKHSNITHLDLTQSNWELNALRSDANDRLTPIPLLVAVYYHLDKRGNPINSTQFPTKATSTDILALIDHRQYYCIAGNDAARQLLGTTTRMLSDHEFFALQADLIGKPLKGEHSTALLEVNLPEVRFQ